MNIDMADAIDRLAAHLGASAETLVPLYAQALWAGWMGVALFTLLGVVILGICAYALVTSVRDDNPLPWLEIIMLVIGLGVMTGVATLATNAAHLIAPEAAATREILQLLRG